RLTTSRYHPRHHSHLPSFPTRRSSDLNGTRKGGQPDAMKILYTAPGMEDLWQMHFSLLSGQEYTVPGVFIANPIDDQPAALPVAAMPPPAGAGAPPPPAHNGPAYWIKVSAQPDGSFTVTNARNGFSKT